MVRSVQFCMSTTCMGANVPFPKKEKLKWYLKAKVKKKYRCPFFAATLDRYSAWTVRSVVLWDIII